MLQHDERKIIILFVVLLLGMWTACAPGMDDTSAQTEISPPTDSKTDQYKSSLKKEVTVNISKGPRNARLTVQHAVTAVCEVAKVPYQWEKSRRLAGTKARRFIQPVNVRNVVAEKAIRDVLSGVGLTFEVDDYGLYLTETSSLAGRLKPAKRSMRKKEPTHKSKLNAQRASQKLSQARMALRGKNKNIPLAKKILLDLAENRVSDLNLTDRCHLYVYLGYIEDLIGNRQTAIGWYKKALSLKGPNFNFIQQLAEEGITKPITWIRHLDAGRQPADKSAWEKNIVERIGKGFVTLEQPPDDVLPGMNLSKAEHLENFDILWEAIDRTYSFFWHKGIDWQEVKTRYRPKVEAVESTEEFYNLLGQFIRELKDCHSWLCDYKKGPNLPRFSPQILTCMIDGKAVIAEVNEGSEAYEKGLRRGSVIIEVDGLSVEEKIEKLRPLLRMSSSERNFLDSAYRRLLDGEKGSNVTLKFLPPEGNTPVSAESKRIRWRKERPAEPDFPVNKREFIWSGIHPSGYGYIRILSFNGRMEIAEEFDHALEKLRKTAAMIIDVRDNTGGFGTAHPGIVGRFITDRTKVAVSYKKSGPGHRDFAKRETYFVPNGDWQYTKPIALLMNARTGSAADLFACYMVSTGRPITIGTTTHGNLTGIGAYVVLPCDLVVRVSNGYVCDASGRVIEGNGNMP